MAETVWKARTKSDLIIEVWEALDCESVGAAEITAIEAAVRERYGANSVDSPMKTARLLADEGAQLRYHEIMELDAARRVEDEYAPMFRNLIKFATLAQAESTLKNLENLRQKFARENDAEGLRRLRGIALEGKRRSNMVAQNAAVNGQKRMEKAEIVEWFNIWLETPAIFAAWLALRQRSPEYLERFVEE